MEEGSSEQPLGRFRTCTLDPSLWAPLGILELLWRVAFHLSLLLPEHGRETHKDRTSWRQEPCLGSSADAKEVSAIRRQFGSLSLFLDFSPHRPSASSCASDCLFLALMISSLHHPYSGGVHLSFSLSLLFFFILFFFQNETTLVLIEVAFNLEVL